MRRLLLKTIIKLYGGRKMLTFIIGLIVGGVFGVFVVCLVTVGKEADDHIEDCGFEIIEDETKTTKTKGGYPK